MRRFIFAAAIALGVVSGPAWAAPETTAPPAAAAPAADATRLALARRYFVAIHYDQMTAAMSEKMIPAMLNAVAKSNPKLADKDRAAVIEATTEASKAFNIRIEGEATQVIAESFSVEELQAMVGFYESAVGQSIMQKSPALITRMTQIAVREMPALQADMLKRLCARMDCGKVKLPTGAAS